MPFMLYYGSIPKSLHCCSVTHSDITFGNYIARDVHCDIIKVHASIMGAYHDVTMHTDVARTLIYYYYFAQL